MQADRRERVGRRGWQQVGSDNLADKGIDCVPIA